MSKTPFDRKRKPELWTTDYFPLGGGLDQRSSALSIKPGRMAQCLNFEEVFGQQGYSFTPGYERFDGQASPSDATYWVLSFEDGGTTAIAAGNTITFSTGDADSAYVLSVSLTSGSWAGGDAAGDIVVTAAVEISADAEGLPIKVGGVTRAVATHDLIAGSRGYADNYAALRLARDYYRDFITEPPGDGELLGGCVFNNAVYAVRTSGVSAILWKSDPSGWQSIYVGLPPYRHRFTVANFTGDPTNLCMYGVNGGGSLFQVTRDDVVTFADPIYGTQATSTSSETISTGAHTITVETGKSFAVGQEVRITHATEWAEAMTGLVTAYNTGTGQLDVNVTGTNGTGTFADWVINLANCQDCPFLVAEHKNHLWLGFQLGQLQSSNLGDPMTYTSTATLIGIGKELTNLQSLKGKVLGVFCEDKISIITGSSNAGSDAWSKEDYSQTAGSFADTVVDNDGNALYLDSRGLSSLQGTLNFGDFESAIFSRDVKQSLDAKVAAYTIVGARMAASKYQYRLYFLDGTVFRFTIITGAAVIQPRDVSATVSKYDHTLSCVFGGVIDGVDRMFFGTGDGWVMEEDSGTSFDGEAIDFVMRLPFNHCKSPANDKQFQKGEFELQCPDEVTFYYRTFFDYDDSQMPFGSGDVDVPGQGGLWDVNAWDTFRFDLPTVSRAEFPLDGQGRNIGFLIWASSDVVRPAVLQGVFEYFTILGMRR